LPSGTAPVGEGSGVAVAAEFGVDDVSSVATGFAAFAEGVELTALVCDPDTIHQIASNNTGRAPPVRRAG
jgi:hypothetical protein